MHVKKSSLNETDNIASNDALTLILDNTNRSEYI